MVARFSLREWPAFPMTKQGRTVRIDTGDAAPTHRMQRPPRQNTAVIPLPDTSPQQTALIVSAHPLFREGIARLLGNQATVVGAMSNWQEVQGLGLSQAPNVIIVDHDSSSLQEKDLAPLLWPDADDLRVIYVTLAGDRMTVHERRQVSGAGEADLLRALKGERAISAAQHTPEAVPLPA